MNRVRCERTWQAEASEDGRLQPKDLASFERHAASCRDCSAEIETLRQIAQQMKSLPESAHTDLEHRRARSELLRKANEQFMSVRPAPNRWTKIAMATALAAGLFVMATRFMGGPKASPPTFDVANISHAVWQTETIASTSRITLQSGTAAFHVEHLHGDARFFVFMPDGKIEVRGTRFIVDVVEGKTRSVEVLEGLVMLEVPRFHGLLHAGDRWPMPIATTSTADAVVPTPSFAAPNSIESANEDAGATIAPAPPIPTAKGFPTTTPTAIVSAESNEPPALRAIPKDEAGPRFAEAMQAFTAGNDARADELFAAFIRDFPRDGRAEDAMFLRAKSRARHGDMAGSAAIARDYLRAFPKGLRRPEAERLAGER